MNVTESTSVLETENSVLSPEAGINVDKMEQVAKVHGEVQDHEGDTVEKPSGEATAISSDIGQTFVPSQTAVSNVALGEEGKETPNEMLFTVVAMDSNISGLIQSSFNSGGLPKEVQLSIVPAGSESATSTINTTDVQNAGLFNQLALLASTMQTPSSPQHQQDETQQFTEQLKDSLPDSGVKSSPFDVASPKTVKENPKSLNKSEGESSLDGKPAKKPRVSCPVCDQDFSDLPSMRRHRLIHSDDKPYQCEFCDKAFRRKDNLREHRNIHTQENVYVCTRCGKTFPRKYTHKVHMAKFCAREKTNTETSARNDEMTWTQLEDDNNAEGGCTTGKISSKSSSNTKCSDPCHICHKTFRDTSTLKRHLLTHSDERPFKCEECNKSFRRKDHLQEHIIVHNEVRPFACHQCGKSFSRKNGLKTHMIRTSHLTVSDAQQEPVILTQLPVEDFKGVKVSDNDELTGGETSGEFQLVLTTNEASPKHTDSENESQVINTAGQKKGLAQTDLGIKDSGVVSDNVDFSEIGVNVNSENSENPGMVVSNADETKEMETTVVLAEKNKETSLANEKDGGVAPRSDSSNVEEFNASSFTGSDNSTVNSEKDVPGSKSSSESEKHRKIQKNIGSALQCPNCRGVFYGKDALWEHFQEHLSDKLFACEHCLTTFTEPELAKEHQMECIDVVSKDICDRVVSVRKNPPAKSGEVATAESSPPEEMSNALTGDTSSDKGETGEEGSSQGFNSEDAAKPPGEKQLRLCTICNKQFRDSTALRRHSLVHSGERPHACEQCGKRFRRRDHLKSHVTAYHSGTTTLHCKNCNMEFTTRYCLATHAKLCKKSGVRPQATTSDATKLTDVAESKCCPVCNKTFKDPSTQRRHLRIHSEERPFQCDVCPKSFRRKDNLKEHMLCHSDQKPFACEDCGKALSRRSSLTNHRSICPMKRMDNNPIASDNHSILETHPIPEDHSIPESDPIPENHSLLESNPIPEPNYGEPPPETLDMCASKVNQELTSSNMNETAGDTMEDIQELDDDDDQGGDKGFSCDHCGKVFRAKWTLKYHQRVHTGEKPYTCLICDRQFRQPSHLKIHQRTHSGERPYVCRACGRAFIDSSTMRRHAKLHKDATDPDGVMDESVSTDETNVHPTEDEVSIQGECIEMAVSSISANETSTQPISTAVVPGMNQSEPANLVQVVRGLVGGEPSQADEMTLSAKIQTLSDVNWQENAQENEQQMTYYIVPVNKESSEKQSQDTFENIPF